MKKTIVTLVTILTLTFISNSVFANKEELTIKEISDLIELSKSGEIKERIGSARVLIKNMLNVYSKKRLSVGLNNNKIYINNLDKAITLEHNDKEKAIGFLKQYILKKNYSELNSKLKKVIPGNIYYSTEQNKVLGDFPEKNKDDLDIILENQINKLYGLWHIEDYKYFQLVNLKKDQKYNIEINLSDINSINLFSNQIQLDQYLKSNSITSHKEREMHDPFYREYNISTGYKEIGEIRVLKPGESLSVSDEINFDEGLPKDQRKYKFGIMISGGKEIPAYGGGLCGISTSIYQSILKNKGLEILKQNVHSIYYSHLYNSKIDGEKNIIPGLDSTILPDFNGKGKHLKDLEFKNITKKPIVIGMTIKDKIDYSLSLGDNLNKGNLSFISKYKSNGHLCFKWKINDKLETKCYIHVY